MGHSGAEGGQGGGAMRPTSPGASVCGRLSSPPSRPPPSRLQLLDDDVLLAGGSGGGLK